MKYKAIIFDVGDTLLEHYPNEEQIYVQRLKHLGFDIDAKMEAEIGKVILETSNEQIIKEQNGAPRMPDQEFEAMLDKAALYFVYNGKEDSEYLETLKNLPIPKQELRVIPGTFEVLQKLKDKGFRLAVVSNHRTWLPDYLTKIGLSQFFETIVVSEVVGVEKPDIRIMQIALNNLALNASKCLYVGDHPFDVLCAKNAGVDCAWLATSDNILPDSVPYKEDYRIQKLHELLNNVL
ncbi:MAG: HAD family hydrolase [Oscillospiraceae bacterium]|nr:HAD family hydrolase [Oscillospiraceae bacterium]